jgi:excinuclease ABC subunit B
MEKELDKQIAKKEKTFITVLTIKMAEELAKHLHQKKYKIAYLHNELKTLERDKIINDLRRNRYDAIIGINLLREGLDVPEVSLVMIFDADKPGLFRSEKSLIQTFGRAARNENGRVILYADVKTDAMIKAINETNRRRSIQEAYNIEHNITPKTIIKTVYDDIKSKDDAKAVEAFFHKDAKPKNKTKAIAVLRKAMEQAADSKEYERAAYLRDLIIELEEK